MMFSSLTIASSNPQCRQQTFY